MIHQAAAAATSAYATNAPIAVAIATAIKEKSWDYLHECIKCVNPQITVGICADGVAPLAKMNQQRKRRYLGVFEKASAAAAAKQPSASNNAATAAASFDKNAISPGTDFMNQLNIYMQARIRDTVSPYRYIYSGTNEIGEGEHKIFARIKNIPHDETIIIYGLDADLIMLSLISHHPNIYLMRESAQVAKLMPAAAPSGAQVPSTAFIYVNIDKFRSGLLRELSSKYGWNIPAKLHDDTFCEEACDIIESYVTLCFMLGNDFLPHIPSLSLKKNGHARLLHAAKTVSDGSGPGGSGSGSGSASASARLVTAGAINFAYVSELLAILSRDENDIIIKLNEEYIRKKPHAQAARSQGSQSQAAPLVNMYPLEDKNKSPLAQIIYAAPSKWRGNYYKELFNCRMHNTEIIVDACKLFIEGIQWTYAYYKQTPKDNRWYYPYGYAPTVLDLFNYIQGSLKDIEGKIGVTALGVVGAAPAITSPEVQLLSILPPQSVDLLPAKLRKYMIDPKYGIAHLFPTEYPIQTYLKTYLWECIPVLPPIDIALIEKCIKD